MVNKQFIRTAALLGENGVTALQNARIAVFGVGGVGGHAVEALARAGVGQLDLIDHDEVSESNINRQWVATWRTLGMKKVEAAKEKILDINPSCIVNCHPVFFLPETEAEFNFSDYDYVLDCVDTMTAKIRLVQCAHHVGTPIICAMGAGNKLDPTRFRVSDITKTEMDPLARVIRRKLRTLGINHLKVVWSDEQPHETNKNLLEKPNEGKHTTPGSVSFVPSAVGLIMAGEVIKDIVKKSEAEACPTN